MTREHQTEDSADQDVIEVPVAWEALSDAFENNAPEVQSYLNLATGEVVRLIDDVADPIAQRRIAHDPEYLLIDPVSSREQYRWMERFIESIDDDSELRVQLQQAIDGKGAFRRFKDVLINAPADRERWFSFRSQRLRSCMESWLAAHSIHAVDKPDWEIPATDEAEAGTGITDAAPTPRHSMQTKIEHGKTSRRELHELVEQLSSSDLQSAQAYLEFLTDRHHQKHTERRQNLASTTNEDAADAELDSLPQRERAVGDAG